MKLPTIPSHWSWKTVSNLGGAGRPAVKAGPFGSALKKSFYVQSGFRVYGQEQVIAGDLSVGDYYIDKEKFESLRSCEVKAGDVLVSLVGTFGKVLVVPDVFEPGIINPRLVRLSFDPNLIDPYFFSRFFQSPLAQTQMELQSHGGTMDILNAKNISELFVPLPPLEEQRRIAAILDKADAVRRKRKEAIALTEELLRSAFLEMFGDPVENPKGWEIITLGNLLLGIESGWSPECDSREAQAEEWGILKLGSVTWGHFNASENKALLPSTTPRPELEVKPGDLLFSRKNTYEHVGASVFVHTTRAKLMLPDLIFRFRLTDVVDPVYVWQSLSQKTMRIKLSRLASGSAGSMPNISKARLRTLPLPIPPLEIQSKYREIVNQFWKKQGHQKASLLSTDDLFSSLLQRAFRGEL
jgi:type I restriction enzyme S subunit